MIVTAFIHSVLEKHETLLNMEITSNVVYHNNTQQDH